jgi:3-dehydroquinate synthase
VLKEIEIASHKGPYLVKFADSIQELVVGLLEVDSHVIVDANVAQIYKEELNPILSRSSTIILEATERNKSIDKVIPVMERLVANAFRRNQTLIAIGGGIIQDITCFIASNLYRGVQWKFVPTTLLAQADSCIGSKSSINLGKVKNIIGTFYPPSEVMVTSEFLSTLSSSDVKSGVGEVLKVHAIDSREAFDTLAKEYELLFTERAVLEGYIRQSLLIKQRYIEVDEFDKNIRNIFNYGHSFGHAIEAATEFAIPHGIAVSIGMDFANHVAFRRKLISEIDYQRMHSTLLKNYSQHGSTNIPIEAFLSALMKDKKNTKKNLVLILPVTNSCEIQKVEVPPDDLFIEQCNDFLRGLKNE